MEEENDLEKMEVHLYKTSEVARKLKVAMYNIEERVRILEERIGNPKHYGLNVNDLSLRVQILENIIASRSPENREAIEENNKYKYDYEQRQRRKRRRCWK